MIDTWSLRLIDALTRMNSTSDDPKAERNLAPSPSTHVKIAHPKAKPTTLFVGNVSTALLVTGFVRYDLMPKLIYAESFLRSGLVEPSKWARFCYVQHEKAFNGFHEACEKRDSFHVGCRAKTTERDFVLSFNTLIRSLHATGFKVPPHAAIPINDAGGMYNGAHRVAAWLALNLSSVIPVSVYDSTVHVDQYVFKPIL